VSKVFSAHAVSVHTSGGACARLRPLEAVPAPGVIHLRYEVVR
jgi:hypothetical protein